MPQSVAGNAVFATSCYVVRFFNTKVWFVKNHFYPPNGFDIVEPNLSKMFFILILN